MEDSIKARATRLDIDEREFMYDELLSQDGHAILYCPVGNTEGNCMDAAVRNFFGRPGTVLGLGDGGAHYGIICDAAYSTFLLTSHVREKGTVSIEQAVNMLSRQTALSVGLEDRGLIGLGYKADLNIIDLDALRLHVPRVRSDLPAGGKRLSQKADGYDATIVSGQVTYRNGRPTGALPGRLVRGSKPAPDARSVEAIVSS
jgi:N-acyl-D-aspartate/D-glutamate deacylase